MVKPLKITLHQFLQGSDRFLDGQPFLPWQIKPEKSLPLTPNLMPQNPGEVSKLTNNLRPDNNKSYVSLALMNLRPAFLAAKSGLKKMAPREGLEPPT